MFKKCTAYVAEKYDKKSYHPVRNIHKVRRFRPLCIVERKKHVGFWKKSSMNPTYLTLRDLLAAKDFQLNTDISPQPLSPKLKDNRGLRLGCTLSTKIAIEQEMELVSGDRMALTFSMRNLVREKVSSEELVDLLEQNFLDHAHPLHLNVKYPKHPLSVVVETLSTAPADDKPEKERVLTRMSDDADTEANIITVDVLSKYSNDVKSSYKYKISPGTVLAYKAVGFKVDTNGKIVLLDVPEVERMTNEDGEDGPESSTPQHSSGGPDPTSEDEDQPTEDVPDEHNKPPGDSDMATELSVTDTPTDDTTSTSGVETKDSKDDLDSSSTSSDQSDDGYDDEPPIMIRDVHRPDLVKKLNNELESFFDLSYFHKIQTDLKTLLAQGKYQDFQMVQLLLYRANLYHANTLRDNFITFPYTHPFMGGEKKMPWRFFISKLGFAVSKCVEKVTVTFPSNDDDDALEVVLDVVNSVLNVTEKSRGMIGRLTPPQLIHLHAILEKILCRSMEANSETNEITEETVTEEQTLLDFLSFCGFVGSPGSSWVLETCDVHGLADVYVVVSVLNHVKKAVVKDKRLLRLPSFKHTSAPSK